MSCRSRKLTLTEQVGEVLGGQPSSLSLDLSGVGFFASGSVSALVAVYHAVEKANTDLDRVNVPHRLVRLLEISGVLSLFRVQPLANADG